MAERSLLKNLNTEFFGVHAFQPYFKKKKTADYQQARFRIFVSQD
jgi:hypothetical protein